MIEPGAYRSIDRCFSLFSSSAALVLQGFLSLPPPLSASVDLRDMHTKPIQTLTVSSAWGRPTRSPPRVATPQTPQRPRSAVAPSAPLRLLLLRFLRSRASRPPPREAGPEAGRRTRAPAPRSARGAWRTCFMRGKRETERKISMAPGVFFFEVRRREQATLKKQIFAHRT
jgi:hypothetical protein